MSKRAKKGLARAGLIKTHAEQIEEGASDTLLLP